MLIGTAYWMGVGTATGVKQIPCCPCPEPLQKLEAQAQWDEQGELNPRLQPQLLHCCSFLPLAFSA